MTTMIDYSKVQPRLMAKYMGLARQSAAAGRAVGSTPEQIVGALLNGEVNWLPEPFCSPLAAILHLAEGGEECWHTMLAVYQRGWEDNAIYYADTV